MCLECAWEGDRKLDCAIPGCHSKPRMQTPWWLRRCLMETRSMDTPSHKACSPSSAVYSANCHSSLEGCSSPLPSPRGPLSHAQHTNASIKTAATTHPRTHSLLRPWRASISSSALKWRGRCAFAVCVSAADSGMKAFVPTAEMQICQEMRWRCAATVGLSLDRSTFMTVIYTVKYLNLARSENTTENLKRVI